MDIKVNGSRLKNLLSYDWIKIVCLIIAGIVVWSLLFTTLGTRVTVGEEFVFHVYENVSTKGSTPKNQTLLNDMKKKGYFSYDVLETVVNEIRGSGQYSASYLLSLRMTTQEGDVMLISDGRADVVTEDKDPTLEIKNLVNGPYLYNIASFIDSARDYCVGRNSFIIFNEDGSWQVDELAVKSYFLNVRLKSAGNYRKTFRTEAQKAEGVRLEIARVKAIYENYLFVSKAIEQAKQAGNDFVWYGEVYTYDAKGNIIEDKTQVLPYGIDLYKLNAPFVEEGKPKIEDTWYTYASGKTTAEGLVLCVFNFESYQRDLQYEALAFIRYIIETYSGYGYES